MLVLERRKQETLCIGDDIRVTVLRIKGDKVTLGIEAPRSIRIDREEFREKLISSQAVRE